VTRLKARWLPLLMVCSRRMSLAAAGVIRLRARDVKPRRPAWMTTPARSWA